jgi:riboflavin synthase alpha subunit
MIASNCAIKSCFQRQEDYEAIKRRLTEIKMTKQNQKLGASLAFDGNMLSKIEEDEEAGEIDGEEETNLEELMEALNRLNRAEEVSQNGHSQR